MSPMIEIKNVTVQLPGFSLKNITMDIPRGAVVGLIGRNGAGETELHSNRKACPMTDLFIYHKRRSCACWVSSARKSG